MRALVRLLGRRLPRTSGTLRVAGIHDALRIRRDSWGIPHIDASSESDAWFGLGFCHAQDRAFQLETLLRVGRGTLSDLVGAGGLAADRMSRRLGFGRVAAAQLAVIDDDVHTAAEAYARGINQGLEAGLSRRPHEFVLLRSHPTPWQVTDVLAFAGLQSFALGANWDIELARLKILAEDGPDALRTLDHAYPVDHPLSVPVATAAGPAMSRLADDLAAFASAAPSPGGSNNWAIAGARTASGVPLLANDPHLAARLPAPWYLAHLRCPEWEVAGASFVGGPVLPVAHNGHAAWGITAAMTDQADLFIEEIGDDGASVREGAGMVPCQVIDEAILVRGGETVTERVLLTRRGPIVSPFLDGAPAALSLSAVWLRPMPIRGFLACLRAHDFETFRHGFAAWPGPALNVVYADADGHVGYQLVGQLPRRRSGHGTLPLPGWLADVGWEDELVPFDEMPHLVDPDLGFVASANNRPAADGAGPYLGTDWMDGYRMARIAEELEGRHDWDVAGCAALQLDVTSGPWRRARGMALDLPVSDADGRLAVAILRGWNGQVSIDSAAASVFALWLAEMARRIAKAKAPASWRYALGFGFGDIVPLTTFHSGSAAQTVERLCAQPAGWFARGWPAEAADALSSAMRQLRTEHGANPKRWGWGRLRTLTLRHPAGDQSLVADAFNLGPVPMPGDGTTPLQAASGPLAPFDNPGYVPNARAVMDLADPEASRWVLAGGQSGNPMSPHYGDLFALWVRGESVPIPWSEESVADATVATLLLGPGYISPS
jgi:penicillin G amidase